MNGLRIAIAVVTFFAGLFILIFRGMPLWGENRAVSRDDLFCFGISVVLLVTGVLIAFVGK
jgi:nitrate reductase gamma subunit